MRLLDRPPAPVPEAAPAADLVRSAPSSPAGPLDADAFAGLSRPPRIGLPRPAQVLWFNLRQSDFVFHHRRRLGDVWSAHGYVRGRPTITRHPEPERPRHRNVTMIPARGGRVVLRARVPGA